MTSPAERFLICLGQCLATHSLYQPGHPARERAVDTAFEALLRVLETRPTITFSFVGADTIADTMLMPEMASWEWGRRLAAVGVARLEVDADVTREAFDRCMEELAARLIGRTAESAVARQLVHSAIRYGTLTVEQHGEPDPEVAARVAAQVEAGLQLSLDDEAETIGWIHGEVADGKVLPLREVETVVRTLGLAMRRDARMLLPLLQIRQYDEYTTTHACNVSVLSMGLAEYLDLTADEVRSFGVAGLLHDVGKVKLPKDLLNKPGRYTDAERALVQQHPMEGAKLLLGGKRGLGLAAIVAYEHHICIDGSGYPTFRHARECHCASRIVHVCDVYDALCTNRPYREAWPAAKALAYIAERSGTEFDEKIATAFVRMMREASVATLPIGEPLRATA